MKTHRFYQITLWSLVLMLLSSLLVSGLFVAAQEDEEAEEFSPIPIEISGTISSVDGTLITVSGLPVEVGEASISSELAVGLVVEITGFINEEGIIVAQVVIIGGTPTPEPEVTETPAPDEDDDPIIVIEGPIQNINVNIITIYNFNISVAPQNPILNLITIGDVVRIEGGLSSTGTINAKVVNTLVQVGNAVPNASVSLQGPVESISGNIVVVNGITAQLQPDDPQLETLQIGDFIDLQGNFSVINNTYMLVVVNVIIINNIFVGIPPYCTWHGMGMGMGMGHWRCEGYWLYPPDHWYCEWHGMGMGMGHWRCDDGMGMGMGMGMGD